MNKPLSEIKPGELFTFLHDDPSEYTLGGRIIPTGMGYREGGDTLLNAILALNRVLENNSSLQIIVSQDGSVKIADKNELVTTSIEG